MNIRNRTEWFERRRKLIQENGGKMNGVSRLNTISRYRPCKQKEAKEALK